MVQVRRSAILFFAFLVVALLAACNPAGPGAGVGLTPVPSPTPVPLPTATTAAQAVVTGEAPLALSLETQATAGDVIERTVDGNAIRLVASTGVAASAPQTVTFSLKNASAPLGTCSIPAGAASCDLTLRADGWAWQDRKLVGVRTVVARLDDGTEAETSVGVAPKPLVLVHGLNSDHTSWINWIKPGGYLQAVGMPGYAVDDGQFGTRSMNTGNPSKPLDGTNSIAENAQVLNEYIEAVRKNTGAERVDVVAHSLGGLISRYYVQNLMPVVSHPGLPDVPVANQLYMAGTPNGGTPCGRIPAALGLFSPASTQITPEYISQVFNPTVNDRRGVPFFGLAGDAVKEKVAIRCTGLPTDRYVSVESVLRGVSVGPGAINGIHSDLNNGQPSFERIFLSIARGPEDYPIVMQDPTEPRSGTFEQVQSTLVQGGTLKVGETVTVTLTIDQARSASFILYAPGSRVNMRIKTVAGRILTEETPATNPNVTFERVQGEETPLSLGYGVIDPRAGAWDIGLTAETTPPGGGTFALVATLDSDLRMSAAVEPGNAQVQQPVVVRAMIESAQKPQQVALQALVNAPGAGVNDVLSLLDDGQHDDAAAGDGVFGGRWTPRAAGEYTVQVVASGTDAAGNPFERLTVLGASVR